MENKEVRAYYLDGLATAQKMGQSRKLEFFRKIKEFKIFFHFSEKWPREKDDGLILTLK